MIAYANQSTTGRKGCINPLKGFPGCAAAGTYPHETPRFDAPRHAVACRVEAFCPFNASVDISCPFRSPHTPARAAKE